MLRSSVRGLSRVAARAVSTAVVRRTSTVSFRRVAAAAGIVAAAAVVTNSKAEAKAVPPGGIPGTIHERTLIAIKPDGVQRGLVAEIIARFEKKGYILVGMKLLKPTEAQAAVHYKDRAFFPALVKYLSSGPIVVMVWQGKDVIKGGRNLLGNTDPLASAPGSIRGDYSIQVERDVCHASDGPESAQDEINLWFPKKRDIVDWEPSSYKWVTEHN